VALFVNDTDHHVTIPDGREGALIVPAGCEAVPGPDGVLIARPHVPEVVQQDGPELSAPAEQDGTGTTLPAFDEDNQGPFEAADDAPEASPKRRRGGSAA